MRVDLTQRSLSGAAGGPPDLTTATGILSEAHGGTGRDGSGPLVLDISALRYASSASDGAALGQIVDWTGITGPLTATGVTLSLTEGPVSPQPTFVFSSGSASIARTQIPGGSPGFSVTLLVYITSLSATLCAWSLGGAFAGDAAIGLFVTTGGAISVGTQGDAHDTLTADGVILVNTWYRITVSFSGAAFSTANPKVYLDGVAKTMTTSWAGSMNLGASNLWIGALIGGSTYLPGRIADCKIGLSGLLADALKVDAAVKAAWGLPS